MDTFTVKKLKNIGNEIQQQGEREREMFEKTKKTGCFHSRQHPTIVHTAAGATKKNK
jgi:hypothetical protein